MLSVFGRCILVLLGAVLPALEPTVIDEYLPRGCAGLGEPSSGYAMILLVCQVLVGPLPHPCLVRITEDIMLAIVSRHVPAA